MELSVTKLFRFEASHYLMSCDTGACKSLHGHSYRVEVTLRYHCPNGNIPMPGAHPGMLNDFGGPLFLQIRSLIQLWDHAVILPGLGNTNDPGVFGGGKHAFLSPQPTAEVMAYTLASDIVRMVQEQCVIPAKQVEVAVWETETGKSTCTMDVISEVE